MNISPLHLCLLFSSALFCVGLIGALARSNTILVLLGVELMLNAANLNFIAFWRFSGAAYTGAQAFDGPIFAVFIIILAACEAAVALGIVINLFHNFGTVEVDTINRMHN